MLPSDNSQPNDLVQSSSPLVSNCNNSPLGASPAFWLAPLHTTSSALSQSTLSKMNLGHRALHCWKNNPPNTWHGPPTLFPVSPWSFQPHLQRGSSLDPHILFYSLWKEVPCTSFCSFTPLDCDVLEEGLLSHLSNRYLLQWLKAWAMKSSCLVVNSSLSCVIVDIT